MEFRYRHCSKSQGIIPLKINCQKLNSNAMRYLCFLSFALLIVSCGGSKKTAISEQPKVEKTEIIVDSSKIDKEARSFGSEEVSIREVAAEIDSLSRLAQIDSIWAVADLDSILRAAELDSSLKAEMRMYISANEFSDEQFLEVAQLRLEEVLVYLKNETASRPDYDREEHANGVGVGYDGLDELDPVEVAYPGDGIEDSFQDEQTESDELEDLEDYLVELKADSIFKVNKNGELKIWIGKEQFRIETEDGMVRTEAYIPAEIGQYAKVTPYAPDFIISPPQKGCILIHPTGSEVLFTLTPKEVGDFKVSATIEIYNDEDCSGPFVPKSAETLTVHVSVDKEKVIREKKNELFNVVWDKFKWFFGALVALLFGLLLYKIKQKIKKRTGYSGDDQ